MPRATRQRLSSPLAVSPSTPPSKRRKAPPTPSDDTDTVVPEKISPQKAKKFAQLESLGKISPFPQWERPTPEECQTVTDLLASSHGLPLRPGELKDGLGSQAGCGEVPSVLDAIVRTILSGNTTSRNATLAKEEMDVVYGRAQYRRVLQEGIKNLETTIKSAGCASIKAKSIFGVLNSANERSDGKGELSLDHMHTLSDMDAMRELVAYDGIGLKTASCVLLFCLKRESMAVDTHVLRISKSLGWIPDSADAEKAFLHLEVRIPNHLKYALHTLLVRHGRGCEECTAGHTTMAFVDHCSIDHLVKRKPRKVPRSKKGSPAKGKKKAESEDEGEEGSLPTPSPSPSPKKRVKKEKQLVDVVATELAPRAIMDEIKQEALGHGEDVDVKEDELVKVEELAKEVI